MFSRKTSKTKIIEAIRTLTKEEQAEVAKSLLDPAAKALLEVYGQFGQKLLDEKTGRITQKFTANGNTYYVLPPQVGLPPLRYSILQKMLIASVMNAPLSQIRQSYRNIRDLINTLTTKAPKLAELVEEIANNERLIMEVGNRNWASVFYTCALFIVREGEDITDFSDQLAESKIEDWNAAGLRGEDFFLSLTLWVSSTSDMLKAKLDLLAKMGLVNLPPASTPATGGA